jgi:hypothetical protein
MPSSILEQAKKQFAKGNYQQVINLLEPHVTQYVVSGDAKDVVYNASFNKSFPFYLYLGLACLHAGDIGGAVDYLTCARRIKMTDPDLLCAQAVLFLRRGDTARAIDYYLEAIEYNPNHDLARSGLDFIRTHNTPEAIGDAVQSGEIKKFYPRPGVQSYIKKRIVLFTGFVAAVFFVALAITVVRKIPFSFGSRNNERADLSAFALLSDEKARPIDTSGTYHYTLSEKEVLAAYRNAQKYFQNSRDNLAQIEVNRILSSNATHSIKQKARLLMDYFATPGFDTVRDIPSYSDVRADIPLYLDCWTVWSGLATNIRSDGDKTSFDLLVGYSDRIQLEGIVPIFCNFSIRIDSERPIEVLGKIQQQGGILFLRASSIHQSQVPENKK